MDRMESKRSNRSERNPWGTCCYMRDAELLTDEARLLRVAFLGPDSSNCLAVLGA